MAMKMDDLKRILEGEKLRYFIDPERDAVLIGFGGVNGRLQLVVSLWLDGQFLQFRSFDYGSCQSDNPHLPALLRCLAEINYRVRLVKFAWDPSDGEISATADLWLMDAGITVMQFKRMLENFVPVLDENRPRIQQAIATGKDPGPEDPEAMAARLLGKKGRLPKPVRDLLEGIRAKKGGREKGPEVERV